MKKILTRTLIIMIIMTFCFTLMEPIIYHSYAAGETSQTEAEKEENERIDGNDSGGFGSLVDGIVGLLLWPLRLLMVILGNVIRAVAGGIAGIGGFADDPNSTLFIGPDQIIFNELNLTDVNFFNITGNNLNESIKTIRTSVASWYYALRNLAIVVLLVVLVYIGIRMTLTNVAEEEAKYKKMLTDWVVSFVLVFLLHYIIIFTVNINDGFVDIFASAKDNIMSESGESASKKSYDDIIEVFQNKSLNLSFSVGMGSAIVFIVLCGVTLIFLIMYIKRMLTVAFLIIIAPLVTITYSIDKMGDGKSQALNTWLKEFVFNILIQPFHCIIYLVFSTLAVNLMQDQTLASAILGVIMILFIFKAEDIVKTIFNFQSKSLGSALAAGAVMGYGLSKLQGLGKSTAKVAGGARAAGAVGGGGSPGDISATVRNNPAISAGNGGDPSPYTPPVGGNRNIGKPRQVAGILAGKVLKGRSGGQFAKDAAKKYASASIKGALMMTGASLGASSGKATNAGVGLVAGKALGNKGTSYASNKWQQHLINNNESRYASEYWNYAEQNGLEENPAMMEQKTRDILESDPEQISDQDRDYANYVYAMRDSYANMGEEDPNERVLDTMRRVQNGSVQPRLRDL